MSCPMEPVEALLLTEPEWRWLGEPMGVDSRVDELDDDSKLPVSNDAKCHV